MRTDKQNNNLVIKNQQLFNIIIYSCVTFIKYGNTNKLIKRLFICLFCRGKKKNTIQKKSINLPTNVNMKKKSSNFQKRKKKKKNLG